MLNIKIINGNPATGNLVFEVNGRSGNGDGEAERNEQVHWIVKPGTPVDSIVGIGMKAGSGTDIFSKNPAKPEKGDVKHWKAQVNDDAPFDDYYYDIIWESNSTVPGEKIRTHDPKISVKPS